MQLFRYSSCQLLSFRRKSRVSSSDTLHSGSNPYPSQGSIVSTIGSAQHDNFSLEGLAPGGHAVVPCAEGSPAGASVVSLPCDAPGLQRSWALDANASLKLAGEEKSLCLTFSGSGAVAADCDGALRYDAATGQIKRGGHHECQLCSSHQGPPRQRHRWR